MLPITTIIERARALTHDKEETGYSDTDMLDVINSAIRFIRRTIKQYKPTMLIEEPLEGSIDAGINTINLDIVPTKIIDVRVDGRKLSAIDIALIEDMNSIGMPTSYYQVGICNIGIYPIPNQKMNYRLLIVGDNKEVTLEDASPLPNDFDDFIIEYIVIRLSLGNEFNMSQETQVMYEIHEQIKANLLGSEYTEHCVRGYFGSYGFSVGGY